jgi:UDPglucose--hexose-1-phosphate uridylyltransferase
VATRRASAGAHSDLAAPEVRIDQLTGQRVILAPGRAERPDAFAPARPQAREESADSCPFCEGREDRTPPEVWASRPDGGEADSPGWTARSVPNLYPVLVPAEEAGAGDDAGAAETGLASSVDPLRQSSRVRQPNLFASQPAVGAHEVIIHAPEHVTSLADLSEERFAGAIAAWRERMRAHADSAAFLHLIVNEGRDAGASLPHSHAQLYALSFVPAEVARERERTGAYHERTMGGHLLSDVATEEVRRSERLVAVDESAILVCPWASRSPFELRVIPRSPAPSFEADGDVGTAMIRRAITALARAVGTTPQLNLWVRTAPRGVEEFCWHVDIVPRLTIRAGFELGTGVDVNTYPPERAASDLREALGD